MKILSLGQRQLSPIVHPLALGVLWGSEAASAAPGQTLEIPKICTKRSRFQRVAEHVASKYRSKLAIFWIRQAWYRSIQKTKVQFRQSNFGLLYFGHLSDSRSLFAWLYSMSALSCFMHWFIQCKDVTMSRCHDVVPFLSFFHSHHVTGTSSPGQSGSITLDANGGAQALHHMGRAWTETKLKASHDNWNILKSFAIFCDQPVLW